MSDSAGYCQILTFARVSVNRSSSGWAADFDCESWAQFSLKFILSHPAVNGIVTETRQVRHVIDNLRAGYGRLPDEPIRQRMSEYLLSL